MPGTLSAVSFFLVCAAAASEDAGQWQCDADDKGSCAPEAAVSLLQNKLEVRSVQGNEQPAIGSLPYRAMENAAEMARAKLVAGAQDGAVPANPQERGSVFSAVDVSLPLGPPVLKHTSPRVEDPSLSKRLTQREHVAIMEDKNIIYFGLQAPCIVYGLGVAPARSGETPSFENEVGRRGCETHAFDCSVTVDDPNVVNASFQFHPWCIGTDDGSQSSGLKDTNYVADKSADLKFRTLTDTMALLGHAKLDLLKFDIEGFEWPLFTEELLKAQSLPLQLSFELHTEGAHPQYVPPDNVKGKGFSEVNKLFLALYDKGYRVVSKEVNPGDDKCAEFVVVQAL